MQTDTHTYRLTRRHTDTDRQQRHTDRHADRQAVRHTDIMQDCQNNRMAELPNGKHAYTQTDRLTERQTG